VPEEAITQAVMGGEGGHGPGKTFFLSFYVFMRDS